MTVTRRRVFITNDGQPATGKTHFLTTCPPPIVVLDLDCGMEGVAEIDVYGNPITRIPFEVPDLDEFGLTASQGERGLGLREYERFKKTLDGLFKGQAVQQSGSSVGMLSVPAKINVNVDGKLQTVAPGRWGTIGVDTGTAAYALAQIARFGRYAKLGEVPAEAWTAMQQEFARNFLQYANYQSNVVVSHWQGTKYRGIAGETELKGYKQMQHLAQVHLNFEKRPIKDAQGRVADFEFVRSATKCRQRVALESPSHPQHEFPVFFTDNAEKTGSVGGDFMTVVQAVFPMSGAAEWLL